jgi:hypothetical protein
VAIDLVSSEFLSGLIIGVLSCIAFPRMIPQLVKDRVAGWFGSSPLKAGTPVDLEGGKTGVVCNPGAQGIPANCPYRSLVKLNESSDVPADGG